MVHSLVLFDNAIKLAPANNSIVMVRLDHTFLESLAQSLGLDTNVATLSFRIKLLLYLTEVLFNGKHIG